VTILVSPAEHHPAIRDLGDTSPAPESFGVDLFWLSRHGSVGVQRKAFPSDFIASVQDGRLAKEAAQMKALNVAVLVLEGHGQWTTDGVLVTQYGGRWTIDHQRAFLWSMRAEGVWVDWTDSIADTVTYIRALHRWSQSDHRSMRSRPGPAGKVWGGRPGNADWERHLLEGFQGIGPEKADAIIDHFGKAPLRWEVTEEELCQVPGIGKGTARKLLRMLAGE
jgi:ERCC4-type nuclease